MKDIEIMSRESFHKNEKQMAKNFWSNLEFKGYEVEKPWSKFIAEKVLKYNANTVFEFGCNVGKNLLEIQKSDSNIKVYGIDINCEAISYSKNKHNLNVSCLDEKIFDVIPDDTYDVSYTVSVLDHVPYPEKILTQLLRISKKSVLLLEPWTGEEGKVIKNFNLQSQDIIDTTPYSYSWDYKSMMSKYFSDWNLSIEEYKLESNLGRFYYLYEISAKKK
ncbi:MAG TPA: methyltransferase domain-containing protein [Arcobacter sp.]|nr:methyltransferase domain-containing protein [Arcobacter sp.]